MARITPPTQKPVDLSQLEDYEPYRATIKAINPNGWDESDHPQYGHQRRLVVDLAFSDDPDLTIRDWISPRLGRQQNGQASKLRMLLNAIAGQPQATEIAWFDDETLEWSYDGDQPYAVLGPDFEVVIRGQITEKPGENGPKRRYTINVYQAAVDEAPKPQSKPQPTRSARPGPKPATGQTPMSRPRRVETDDDDTEAPF